MRILYIFTILLSAVLVCVKSDQAALFIDTESLDSEEKLRQNRQVDVAVKSILEWIQNRYSRRATYETGNRRSSNSHESAASQPSRQYLPVPEDIQTTQRPRPFQTYVPPQLSSTAQPFPSSRPSYPQPSVTPDRPRPSYPQPSVTPDRPRPSYPQPSVTPDRPRPSYPQPSVTPDRPRPSYPQPSVTPDRPRPTYSQPTRPSSVPSYTYQPSPSPTFNIPPSTPPPLPSTVLPPEEGPYLRPSKPQPSFPSVSTNGVTIQTSPSPTITDISGGNIEADFKPDGGNHPPHIHEVNVQCAKDQMTINIEFNTAFNGVIYSKGFFNQESCRYVQPNSGQAKYSFTVRLDSCGTQFVEKFQEEGQAYLENTLVLQNEPGIQEVWDTIRRVRCLWEGSLNKALSIALSVGMLSQETITFSGDTAVARLDIQMGKGPFAPAATGLVKIGETMTLVVSVEGDPGFDILVRDCFARDSTSTNVVQLTDERGCVIKKKLFGSFQKTRETGNSQTSIIAYAFFQAFKFPDVMDLTIDCNVELCKTDCEVCPDPNQSLDPVARKKRDLWTPSNETLGEPVRVMKTFRVITPDDLESTSTAAIISVATGSTGICMSFPSFLTAAVLLLTLLIGSCILTAVMWISYQKKEKFSSADKLVHFHKCPSIRN